LIESEPKKYSEKLERGFTKEKELEESLKYEIAKEHQDVYKQSGNKNK
jgi:hypothetical protein